MLAAGLVVERVRAEAIVQTPTQPYVAGAIVRAVLPRIVAADATFVGELVFTAWARKPPA